MQLMDDTTVIDQLGGCGMILPIQKEAIKRMIQLQNEYGVVFLEKSLHAARFEYAALKRVAEGLDTSLPSTKREDGT
jgi:hypothetical protein